MGLLNRITKAAVAVIAAVAISPVIITAHAGHGDERYEPPGVLADMLPMQTEFKMMMNYELGMHCTGFEFAYCCVLPAYNSILAQVVKPQNGDSDFPHLLESDPRANVNSILDPVDPGTGDVLGRHTVLRDPAELDRDDNFQKYVLRYWHDAQPRGEDPNGKPQVTTRISNVELNSLMSWNTVADAADLDADGSFKLSGTKIATGLACTDEELIDPAANGCHPLYNGSRNVVLGNNSFDDTDVFFTEGLYGGPGFDVPIDNYQNVVWNHLYIYEDTEGTGGNPGGNAPDSTKLRLGLHVGYPTNFGPGGHGMEGLLTFSEDTGTVVYTQMKVLEDLPITLTSPRIWEALGLPLTPFEDTIAFFEDPGLVDEDSVRPYVQMKARLHHADCDPVTNVCTEGAAVLDRRGNEVVGFGTAPIDIPNCERCHSAFNEIVNGVPSAPNSPNVVGTAEAALVQQEINFWLAYYPSMQTGSDWYARLKGAAISILGVHDDEHGTSFLADYPGVECSNFPEPIQDGDLDGGVTPCGDLLVSEGNPGAGVNPLVLAQNTRAGHESVICQKCHADNVIAVVKSANCGPDSNPLGDPEGCADGDLIPPLTEAIHYNHREESEGGVINFADSEGRSGGCQGCHPAHRSDGNMADYPIDLDGNNAFASGDNRDAAGGCFVGRDVHSNPLKDIDGAETPEHLNPVGQWLATNVFSEQRPDGSEKGIWCTNCHQQFGQEMWKAENVADLVNAQPGDAGNVRQPNPDAANGGSLQDVVNAVNTSLGTSYSLDQVKSWLDPADPEVNPSFPDGGNRLSDTTHAIWAPDPGLCDYVDSALEPDTYGPVKPAHDANVAVVGVNVGGGNCPDTALDVNGDGVITNDPAPDGDLIVCNAASFQICGSTDDDGDFNVLLVGTTAPDSGPFGGAFCTTTDCLENSTPPPGVAAVAVPFSAATDGRDHWLAPGEPHCADCHAAPYVEQSGNVNAFAPFNYPRKASLMRYSRGHQDITCQGCHESIHGLYPVTPTIDTTSYWQAASLNDDHSHGPLKCGTCHETNSRGVWKEADDLEYNGVRIEHNLDAAISWMHTFTEEADPRVDFCQNCHGDETGEMQNEDGEWEEEWLEHARRGRASRSAMDKVEILEFGHVAGDPDTNGDGIPFNSPDDENPLETVCVGCHSDERDEISCERSDGREWKEHLTEGRVSMSVWEYVSLNSPGTNNTTCGW